MRGTGVWSVSYLLFFYSRCPRAQPFLKVGARAPRAPWSRRLGATAETLHYYLFVYFKIDIVHEVQQQTIEATVNNTKQANKHLLIFGRYLKTFGYSASYRPIICDLSVCISTAVLIHVEADTWFKVAVDCYKSILSCYMQLDCFVPRSAIANSVIVMPQKFS